MNVLIVYYSLSGTTASLRRNSPKSSLLISRKYAAVAIRPVFWEASEQATIAGEVTCPPIEPLKHALSRYHLVVIGGPIWAFHPETPVRAFLQQEASRLSNAAFFLTHGGSAATRSLREMELLAGRTPMATLIVREVDVKEGKFGCAVSSFASVLRKKKGAC